jgi:hypothetical protein
MERGVHIALGLDPHNETTSAAIIEKTVDGVRQPPVPIVNGRILPAALAPSVANQVSKCFVN